MDKNQNIVVDDVHDDAFAAMESLKQEPPAEAAPADGADEAPEAKAEQPRGPDGKFARKNESAPEEPAEKPVEAAKPDEKLPEAAPEAAPEAESKPQEAPAEQIGGPPGGWSPAAKAAWDTLPPAVREAAAKREQEVSDGFRMYEGLKPFAEMARQGGTTLQAAVSKYVTMENILRQDHRGGFLAIANNIGLTQHQAGELFARLARELGQEIAPAPGADNAPQDGVPNLQHALNPVMQKVTSLEQMIAQQHQQMQAAQTASIEAVVEKFRSQHRYFGNVEDAIAQLLASNFVPRTGDHAADLAKAYEIACKLNPEVSAAIAQETAAKAEADRKAREKQVAQQAKAASKSITGSPAPGTVVSDDDNDDIEAAARRAYRQLSMQ